MIRTLLALLLSASVAWADFSDDQYADPPDALSQIIAAAEGEQSQFRSSSDGAISYYLRSAEYIGPCVAPFGPVHIARLFYIRSAPKGSKKPARGHTFIVFLDHEFKIRGHWKVGFTLGQLSVSGSKLLLDDKELLDYSQFPASGHIAADGAVLEVVQWK